MDAATHLARSRNAMSRFATLLLLGVCVINVLAVVIAGIGLQQNHRHYEDRAAVAAQNLNQVLVHDIGSSIDKIDVALQSISDEVQNELKVGAPNTVFINTLLRENRRRIPEISALRIANAEGNVVFGVEDPPAFDTYLDDATYFFSVRTPTHKGLLISKPLLSRIDGSWMVVLARRVDGADGKRAGLVYAGLRIDQFLRQFAALDIGRRGTVFLADGDFDLVARYPVSAGNTLLEELKDQIRAAPQANFTSRAGANKIERFFSVRKVPDYPFYLGVGIASADALAPWKREGALTGAIVAVFCLVTCLAGLQLVRAWRRQSLTLESLRQSRETLEIIETNVSDVIARLDPWGRYLYVSRAVLGITGYSEHELLGQPVTAFLHPDDAEALAPRAPDNMHPANGDVVVYRFRHKDGHYLWVEACSRAVRDADNRVLEYVIVSRDITERKNAERQIEFLAYHDTLTELPNRLLAQDRLRQAMAHADRTQTKIAVLFFDLDKFKVVNDTLGHGIGDGLLKGIAQRLLECVRDTDTVCRLGGDEFLVMLRDLPTSEAAAPVLAKLNTHLQAPFQLGAQEVSTSASIGVAIYPDDGRDFDTLLKKADLAMYRAKKAGRNTYSFYDPNTNIGAAQQLTLESQMRRALARSEFVLGYRPRHLLRTGALVGFEASLQWQHPEDGLLAAERFLPQSERNGLAVDIGNWALHEAIDTAARWPEPLELALNVPPMLFVRGQLGARLGPLLAAAGLAPERLELILTDAVFGRERETLLAAITGLRKSGVRFAIDAFGLASLSLFDLQEFGFSTLKLDPHPVRTLHADPHSVALMRAAIQTAHSLSLRTVADGADDESIATHLRTLGCDAAQGTHYGEPMNAAALSALLEVLPETHPTGRTADCAK